jgi:hypothetical protein
MSAPRWQRPTPKYYRRRVRRNTLSSTIDHRPSTIDHRPSTIDHRPSTIIGQRYAPDR